MDAKAAERLVLLLEDDAAVTRVIETALRREGLALTAVGQVADFFPALARRRPDLALLDIELPDGDGFEVCRRLQEDPATKGIPVIFLTAKGDAASRLKGFQCGARDYVPKPFDPAELVARVRAHLDLSQRLHEGERRVAEMSLRERFQRDLMDMIVHDLRSPLATVQMSLRLLGASGLVTDAQQKRLLATADDALEFSLVMVNDLLDLDAGRVAVRPAAFSLSELTARLEGMLGPSLARRGLRFVRQVPAGADRLVCDEQLIFRVLMNLCGNAIKFSPTGETVSLRANHAGGRLRLEVEDRGPGIPDAEKELIFEKFYRVESTSKTVPGSGIGLSFCRLAAGALGGRVFAEDVPAGGSRFVLEVPVETAAGAGASELFGPEIMGEYLSDCAADIQKAEAAVGLGQDPLGPAQLESLRVLFHRLSGSAGTYGFPEVSAAAKAFENRIIAAGKGAGAIAGKDALEALKELRRGLKLAA